MFNGLRLSLDVCVGADVPSCPLSYPSRCDTSSC